MRNRHYALGRLKQGQRNKLEAAYEARLQLQQQAGEVLWFRFEGMKFRLADNTFYTPDFNILLPDGSLEMHDTKGSRAIFSDDAKVKIKVASSMYPFRFFAVFPKRKKDGGGFEFVEY